MSKRSSSKGPEKNSIKPPDAGSVTRVELSQIKSNYEAAKTAVDKGAINADLSEDQFEKLKQEQAEAAFEYIVAVSEAGEAAIDNLFHDAVKLVGGQDEVAKKYPEAAQKLAEIAQRAADLRAQADAEVKATVAPQPVVPAKAAVTPKAETAVKPKAPAKEQDPKTEQETKLKKVVNGFVSAFEPSVPRWKLAKIHYELKPKKDLALGRPAFTEDPDSDFKLDTYTLTQPYAGAEPFSKKPTSFTLEISAEGKVRVGYTVADGKEMPKTPVSDLEGIKDHFIDYQGQLTRFIETTKLDRELADTLQATIEKVVDLNKGAVDSKGEKLNLVDGSALLAAGIDNFIDRARTSGKKRSGGKEMVYTMNYNFKTGGPKAQPYGTRNPVFEIVIGSAGKRGEGKVTYQYSFDHINPKPVETSKLQDVKDGFRQFNDELGSYCHTKDLVGEFNKNPNEWKLADDTKLEVPADAALHPSDSGQRFDKGASIYWTDYKFKNKEIGASAKFELRTTKGTAEIIYNVGDGKQEKVPGMADAAAIKAVFDLKFLPAVDKFVEKREGELVLEKQAKDLRAAEAKFVNVNKTDSGKLTLKNGSEVRLESKPAYLEPASIEHTPATDKAEYVINQKYLDTTNTNLVEATCTLTIQPDGTATVSYKTAKGELPTDPKEVKNEAQIQAEVAKFYQAVDTYHTSHKESEVATELQQKFNEYIEPNGINRTAETITLKNGKTLICDATITDKTVSNSRVVRLQRQWTKSMGGGVSEFTIKFTKDSAKVSYDVITGGASKRDIDIADSAALESLFTEYTEARDDLVKNKQKEITEAATTAEQETLKAGVSEIVDLKKFKPAKGELFLGDGQKVELGGNIPTILKPVALSMAPGKDKYTFTVEHFYKQAGVPATDKARFVFTVDKDSQVTVTTAKYYDTKAKRVLDLNVGDVTSTAGLNAAIDQFYDTVAEAAKVEPAKDPAAEAAQKLEAKVKDVVDIDRSHPAQNELFLAGINQKVALGETLPFLEPAAISVTGIDKRTYTIEHFYDQPGIPTTDKAKFSFTIDKDGKIAIDAEYFDTNATPPEVVAFVPGDVRNAAGIKRALEKFYKTVEAGAKVEADPNVAKLNAAISKYMDLVSFEPASNTWLLKNGAATEQLAIRNNISELDLPRISKVPMPDGSVVFQLQHLYKNAIKYGADPADFSVMISPDGKAGYAYEYAKMDAAGNVISDGTGGWKEVLNSEGIKGALGQFYTAVEKGTKVEDPNAELKEFAKGYVKVFDDGLNVWQLGDNSVLNQPAHTYLEKRSLTMTDLPNGRTYTCKNEYKALPGSLYNNEGAFVLTVNDQKQIFASYQIDSAEPAVPPRLVTSPAEIRTVHDQFYSDIDALVTKKREAREKVEKRNEIFGKLLNGVGPDELILKDNRGLKLKFDNQTNFLDNPVTSDTVAADGSRVITLQAAYKSHGTEAGRSLYYSHTPANFELVCKTDGTAEVRYQVADTAAAVPPFAVSKPDDVANAFKAFNDATKDFVTNKENELTAQATKKYDGVDIQALSRRMRLDQAQPKNETDKFASRTAIEKELNDPNSEIVKQVNELVNKLALKQGEAVGRPIDFAGVPAADKLAKILGITIEQVSNVFQALDAQIYEQSKLDYLASQATASTIQENDSFITKAGKTVGRFAQSVAKGIKINAPKLAGGSALGAGAVYLTGFTFFGLASAPLVAGAIGGAYAARLIDNVVQDHKTKKGIAAQEKVLRGQQNLQNVDLKNQLTGNLALAKFNEMQGRFQTSTANSIETNTKEALRQQFGLADIAAVEANASLMEIVRSTTDYHILTELNNAYAEQRDIEEILRQPTLIESTKHRLGVKNVSRLSRIANFFTLSSGDGALSEKVAQSTAFTLVAAGVRTMPVLREITTAIAGARAGAAGGQALGEIAGRFFLDAKHLGRELRSSDLRSIDRTTDSTVIDQLIERLVVQLNDPKFKAKHEKTPGQSSLEYQNLVSGLADLQQILVEQSHLTSGRLTGLNDRYQAERLSQDKFATYQKRGKVIGMVAGAVAGRWLGQVINELRPVKAYDQAHTTPATASRVSDWNRINPFASNTAEAQTLHPTAPVVPEHPPVPPAAGPGISARVEVPVASGSVDPFNPHHPKAEIKFEAPTVKPHVEPTPVAPAPATSAAEVAKPVVPKSFDAVVHGAPKHEGFSNPLKRWLESKSSSGHVSAHELRAKVDNTYIKLDGQNKLIFDENNNTQLWDMVGDKAKTKFIEHANGKIEMQLFDAKDGHRLSDAELHSLVQEHSIHAPEVTTNSSPAEVPVTPAATNPGLSAALEKELGPVPTAKNWQDVMQVGRTFTEPYHVASELGRTHGIHPIDASHLEPTHVESAHTSSDFPDTDTGHPTPAPTEAHSSSDMGGDAAHRAVGESRGPATLATERPVGTNPLVEGLSAQDRGVALENMNLENTPFENALRHIQAAAALNPNKAIDWHGLTIHADGKVEFGSKPVGNFDEDFFQAAQNKLGEHLHPHHKFNLSEVDKVHSLADTIRAGHMPHPEVAPVSVGEKLPNSLDAFSQQLSTAKDHQLELNGVKFKLEGDLKGEHRIYVTDVKDYPTGGGLKKLSLELLHNIASAKPDDWAKMADPTATDINGDLLAAK